MKFLIATILLISTLSATAYASNFSTIEVRNGIRVDVNGSTGINNFGTYGLIFVDILEHFKKTLAFDSSYIYIDLNSNYSGTLSKYKLSYDTVELMVVDGDTSIYPFIKRIGLKVSVNVDNLIFSDILKLVYYGLKNPDIIKFAQRSLNDSNTIINEIDKKRFSNMVIQAIISKPAPEIDTVLDKKFYRRMSSFSDAFDKIDYYYQNEKFYVYKTTHKKRLQKYKSVEEWQADTLGKRLFVFDNINYILGDSQNNYLIFVTDSCFYHLFLNEERIAGPFYTPMAFYFDSRSSIIVKDNNIIIPHPYGWGNIIYNYSDGSITYDTNSIDPKNKDILLSKMHSKKKSLIEKTERQAELQNRKINVLIFLFVAILINVFLFKYKG